MFMSDTLETALKRDLKSKRPSAQRAGGLQLVSGMCTDR